MLCFLPAVVVPTVPSAGRWWHGTDPTASTSRKAPSHTCALSWSATVTALTVKSHHCHSPRPGNNNNNNGAFRKLWKLDLTEEILQFSDMCPQGTSQLSQALPSTSVQSPGSGSGWGRGYQYFRSAGRTPEEPAVQTDGLVSAGRDSGGETPGALLSFLLVT